MTADSAQFSAALSDATDARYVGAALTVQYAIGFLITIATIRLLPTVADGIGWRWALTVLALGPIGGVLAIRELVRKFGGAPATPSTDINSSNLSRMPEIRRRHLG